MLSPRSALANAALLAGITSVAIAVRSPSSVAAMPLDRDEQWSVALWNSLTVTDEAMQARATAAFRAALDTPGERSPIYTWMGDLNGGTQEMFKAGHAVLRGMNTTSDVELSVDRFLCETTEAIGYGDSHAVKCFMAAIAEDPLYVPAWYRLSIHSDGELTDVAISELLRIDPQNAIGHYLRAAAHLEAGNFDGALWSVEAGNAAAKCHVYPLPYPANNRLHFPDEVLFRQRGVDGKPIPSLALRFFVESWVRIWDFSDPLPRKLREIVRTFLEEAARLAEIYETSSAMRILKSVQALGLRLIRNESQNESLIACAFSPAIAATRELVSLHHIDGSLDIDRRDLRQLLVAIESFRLVFFDLLQNPSDSDFDEILCGKLDFFGRFRDRLRAAVASAKFD